MWWPLILLGGPLFWLVFAGWVVLMCVILDAVDSIDRNRGYPGTGATFATLLFVAIMCLFGNGTVALSWLCEHWVWIAVGFIPAGIVTAIGKWWFFGHDCKEAFDKGVCEYKRNKQLANPDTPELTPEQWADYLPLAYSPWVTSSRNNDGGYTYAVTRPTWQANKARITTWMTWWFIVLPWSLLHDFVHRLFRRIVQLMGGWFDNISARIWGKLPDPVVVPPKVRDDNSRRFDPT